jgi:tRNA(fMet)-specific endonuclease VapC
LDTNQAIAILNDDPAAIAFYQSFAELCLPVIVMGELQYGALNSGRPAENLAKIDRLARRCTILNLTEATARSYARLRMALKKIAKPIPENDLWIAATCDEHRLPLAIADAHFRVVPNPNTVSIPSP